MRIATSSVYIQQSTAIDNLETQYQAQGLDLSTGKSLNVPADDPTQIGLDLNIRTSIATGNQQTTNISAATNQLTSTDSALANLTSILQSARELASRGASNVLSPTELKDIGVQVDQLLQQTVAIANTKYAGSYIFAGSEQSSTPPIVTSGSPISSVSFTGNEQTEAPLLFNGRSFSLSPTMQQSFNQDATNGSPSVFQVLTTLRDTLDNGTVIDESAQSINQPGQVIYGAASPSPTTLAPNPALVPPTPFAIQPVPDSSGQFSISINNTDAGGKDHVNLYTFPAAIAVDGASGPGSITGEINANTATTGLTATFNAQTQRLVLSSTGGGSFSVTDEPPSPGQPISATNATSNFTTLFGLATSATYVQTVSTQLGDIDNALAVTLNARAIVGSRINALAQINTQVSTDVLDNTSVQSGLEDTNVAKATSQFSATQTALTASFSVTSRLEGKDLFDYL